MSKDDFIKTWADILKISIPTFQEEFKVDPCYCGRVYCPKYTIKNKPLPVLRKSC